MALKDWKKTPSEIHQAWNKRDDKGLHGIMVYHTTLRPTNRTMTQWESTGDKPWTAKVYLDKGLLISDRKYRFATKEKAQGFAKSYMRRH
jgi:RES domain-containing protein